MRDLPEPAVEWVAFSSAISALNDRTPLVWDPITKKMKKWIDIQKLNAIYGKVMPSTYFIIKLSHNFFHLSFRNIERSMQVLYFELLLQYFPIWKESCFFLNTLPKHNFYHFVFIFLVLSEAANTRGNSIADGLPSQGCCVIAWCDISRNMIYQIIYHVM